MLLSLAARCVRHLWLQRSARMAPALPSLGLVLGCFRAFSGLMADSGLVHEEILVLSAYTLDRRKADRRRRGWICVPCAEQEERRFRKKQKQLQERQRQRQLQERLLQSPAQEGAGLDV